MQDVMPMRPAGKRQPYSASSRQFAHTAIMVRSGADVTLPTKVRLFCCAYVQLNPKRMTARLRWGRVSIPGSTYFATHCVQHREPLLAGQIVAGKIEETLLGMHNCGDFQLIAGMTMPDHTHLLFTLGRRLRLGQVFGKFKSLARGKTRGEWHWQEDGFEHQLRENDSIEDYAFYIFMNPYRAGLIPLNQRWRWWICPAPERLCFLSHISSGEPIPSEWVSQTIQMRNRLGFRH